MGWIPPITSNSQMDLNKLNYLKELEMHHVGYVCKDINLYKNYFLHFSKLNEFKFVYEDANQNVRAGFIELISGLYIELLEILDAENPSPILNFINKNTSGFHHICYQSNNLEDVLSYMKAHKFRLISDTSNGFEGRDIKFFIPKKNPDGPLIEVVSAPKKSQA